MTVDGSYDENETHLIKAISVSMIESLPEELDTLTYKINQKDDDDENVSISWDVMPDSKQMVWPEDEVVKNANNLADYLRKRDGTFSGYTIKVYYDYEKAGWKFESSNST